MATRRKAPRKTDSSTSAKLASALKESKALADQQAATGEILRVIASSPSDVQPVFDAIARSAQRLFGAHSAAATRAIDGVLHLQALTGTRPAGEAAIRKLFPAKVSDGTGLSARAARAGKPQFISDAEIEYSGTLRKMARARGFRSALAVPMLRKGEVIGTLSVARREAGSFTKRQINLLKTFADQAVIAIENARLFNETKEALERQTATAGILKVISTSPTDVQPVFDALAKRAAQLCSAAQASVMMAEGDVLRRVATVGHASPITELPIRRTLVYGRAFLERRAVHVDDILAVLDEYPDARENQSRSGFRTLLAVPMVREGEAIGAIGAWHREVRPFTREQVELLETFAAQAVIAIENVRLFNETREALERQTATAEILRVMSSSPTDIHPVFEAIADAGMRLFRAWTVFVTRYDGRLLHFGAARGAPEDAERYLRAQFPRPPSPDTAATRCVLEGKVVHVPDSALDPSPRLREIAAKRGFRSVLAAPMLKNGMPIGAINVTRTQPGGFSDIEIDFLRTFADQAVIAIENVRLFNETKEALDRQTATAGILGVIASSPTDLKPVMNAVVENAARLAEADHALIGQVEQGAIRWLAAHGCPLFDGMQPISRGLPSGRAMLDLETTQVADIAQIVGDERVARAHRELGVRTICATPLVREGRAVGVLLLRRTEVRAFSDKQISLLKTFADQAAIAIENVRLFNETKEALEQQTAISEILRVISASPTDVQPVFESIVHSAAKLLDSTIAAVFRYDGGLIHFVAGHNFEARMDAIRTKYPAPVDDSLVSGRVIQSRSVVRIEDSEADPDYDKTHARTGGWRRLLGVPMMKDGVPLGVLVTAWDQPGPILNSQEDLLRTFADQAVIAIENVRLFNETKEALEQQTATAEILKVISSSPMSTQPVFEAIVQSAARLFAPSTAVLVMREGDLLERKARGGPANVLDRAALASIWPLPFDPERSMAARCIVERRIIEIPDTDAPGLPAIVQPLAKAAGYRAITLVPLIREGEGIGLIALNRPEPGFKLTEKQLALVSTFADQAVIAIENVRLFNETKEALEQQTATSEVLNVLSRSTLDVTPVFQAVVDKAVALCGADNASILQREGDVYRYVANAGRFADQESFMSYWGTITLRPGRGSLTGRVALERRSVQIEDIDTDPEYERDYAAHKVSGSRAHLGVPLLKDGEPVGLIIARRFDVRPFADKQIRLLQTFAAQAVIAIENVRLFKELDERTQALTTSVGQLTALGEVGQAISSTLDPETVLKTIVAHAVQLTGVDSGAIYEYDEATELFRLQAAEKFEPELVEAVRKAPIRKGDGATGRIAVTLEAEQVPDIEADSYRGTRKNVLARAGYRAVLAVPLLRENHLLGALQVFRRAAGAFAPDVVELLKTFATQSAVAIQNARLYREIEEKSRELETASKHKSQFLASMSHELRTPLNAILGFNEMILDGIYGDLTADIKAPLENIQSSGKHLLRLINNVLDLAKIEAGRMELALADFSVQDAVANVHSTLKPLAAEKGLEFVAEVPDDIPAAHGDAGRLAQCLMNLAGNSLKFTKEGRVAIAVAQEDGLLRFSVADTGIGIAPDKISGLFTEFKQSDATIASEYGGTGLGLSITKKFIEMHGGRIWVESEPGKGSTFRFEIPLRAGL